MVKGVHIIHKILNLHIIQCGAKNANGVAI